MIWFDNHQAYGTANYYVQKLFMNHQGAYKLDSTLSGETDGVYQVSSLGEDGSIILKLVNVSGTDVPLSITLSDASVFSGTATVLKSDSPDELNTFKDPEHIVPQEESIDVSDNFSYVLPKYSVSVLVLQ